MKKPKSWWGVPVLVVIFALLGGGFWVIQGASVHLGMAWEGDVLRTGTATVGDCRPSARALFLSQVCSADIVWDGDIELPRSVREAEAPYEVWSDVALTGEHPVVTHKGFPATRRGQPDEVITTVEHAAGANRGWLGLGYLAMFVVPAAGGILTYLALRAWQRHRGDKA